MLEGVIFDAEAVLTLREDRFRRFKHISALHKFEFSFKDRFDFDEFYNLTFNKEGKGVLDVYKELSKNSKIDYEKFLFDFDKSKNLGFGNLFPGASFAFKKFHEFGNLNFSGGKRLRIGISSIEFEKDIFEIFKKNSDHPLKYIDTLVTYDLLKKKYGKDIEDIRQKSLKETISLMGIKNNFLYVADQSNSLINLEKVRGYGALKIKNVFVVGAGWKRGEDYFKKEVLGKNGRKYFFDEPAKSLFFLSDNIKKYSK